MLVSPVTRGGERWSPAARDGVTRRRRPPFLACLAMWRLFVAARLEHVRRTSFTGSCYGASAFRLSMMCRHTGMLHEPREKAPGSRGGWEASKASSTSGPACNCMQLLLQEIQTSPLEGLFSCSCYLGPFPNFFLSILLSSLLSLLLLYSSLWQVGLLHPPSGPTALMPPA